MNPAGFLWCIDPGDVVGSLGDNAWSRSNAFWIKVYFIATFIKSPKIFKTVAVGTHGCQGAMGSAAPGASSCGLSADPPQVPASPVLVPSRDLDWKKTQAELKFVIISMNIP